MILAEIIDKIVSGEWGNEKYSDDTPHAVSCIRGADIVPILNVDYDNIPVRYISNKSYEKKRLREGDIVIEKSGGSPTQSTGRVIIVTKDLLDERKDLVCSNFCEAIRLKEGWNPFFVFSYLQYLYNQGVFFNFEGKTSGLKNLQMDQAFKSIDIPKQSADVSILASIDNKISINRKINKDLATLARLIYDYWFVQFDFPNEEGKPYKCSGGKMIWDERVKREIPEGWEVMNIFDAANVLYGYPFTTESFVEELTDKPVVRIRDILDNTSSAYTTEDVDELYRLNEGDLVIGMDGNFHMNYWHDNKCYLNQRCVRFRDIPEVPLSTMQLYFNIKPVLDHKQGLIQGSTVGHLLDSDIKEFWIICPPQNKRKYIKTQFDNILCSITRNKQEIIELDNLRNYLLPLLMNGQVTIKD